ncbi:MAG: alpha/beta fold hydrolase [Phycisphaerales bacterium]|nr:alpha/beta fold hydrolase [Phycisphaerales bacterium]
MKIRLPLSVILCLCLLMTIGCTRMFAKRMVAAPNAACQKLFTNEDERHLRILVGGGEVPNAVLAMWIVEPKKDVPHRGTVLLLHGIVANRHFVMKTAKSLSNAGYRAVAIDLRGHGKSTGKYLTYGVFESSDMSQVLDYLQMHQLAGEKIGVYGCSYGAATAIQFAAKDPRVIAVVAVASFSSLHEEAPHFARTILPIPGLFLSDKDYENIIAEAGRIAKFNPADASPVDAITKTKARVLLIHGKSDLVTKPDHSQRIHAASKGGGENTELKVLPHLGHMAVSFELSQKVLQLTREWFDANL